MRRTRVSGARVVCLAFAAAVAITWLSAHAEGDGVAAQGREKSRMCEGCHGLTDYRNAFPAVYRIPKLGEQQSAYIVKALQDYRSGSRRHSTMRSIAATLSDQDMADLAAYYSAPTHR
jgi:cytochrome c553